MTENAEEKAAAEKAAAGKPAAKKKARAEPVLRVSGPPRGRRRAGHAFGAVAVDLRIADLTDEQIAAIKADPELVVGEGLKAAETDAEDA